MAEKLSSSWRDKYGLESNDYQCGHCGKNVGSNTGYSLHDHTAKIYLCPFCNRPTYFEKGKQTPGPLKGEPMVGVPQDIQDLYDEARRGMTINASTSVVLACRKILMHIAVQEGADEGLKYIDYVEYLDRQGFVPPKGKKWVDHIRQKGNEANHDIVIMQEKDALELLQFIEMLLRFNYDFPSKIPTKAENVQ